MSQTAVLPSKTSTQYTSGITLSERASHDVLANVLEDPSLSNKLKTEALKDFQKLSIEICNIDKDFQAISGKLHIFDAQKFLDVNGNVLSPLQPQWIGHKEKFKDLVNASRANAIKASGVLTQYTTTVLSDFKCEISEIQAELAQLMSKVSTESENAYAVERNFKTLSEDLHLFAAIVEDALKRAESALQVAPKKARRELAQLKEDLMMITMKMYGMGAVCLAYAAAGVTAVALTFITLSPAAYYAVLEPAKKAKAAGQGFISARHNATDLKSKIQAQSTLYADLKAQAHAKLKVFRKDALKDTPKEICTLADKINAISHTWQTIKADMQMLQERLEYASSGSAVASVFNGKLCAVRDLYLKLAEVLEAYGKNDYAI